MPKTSTTNERSTSDKRPTQVAGNVAIYGPLEAVQLLRGKAHQCGFIEAGALSRLQKLAGKGEDNVICVYKHRFKLEGSAKSTARANIRGLQKPNWPTTPAPPNLLWAMLDDRMRAGFDATQHESCTGDKFQPWDNDARAIWCQWQLEDDRLSHAERLKILLWLELGEFEIDVDPSMLAVSA